MAASTPKLIAVLALAQIALAPPGSQAAEHLQLQTISLDAQSLELDYKNNIVQIVLILLCHPTTHENNTK